MPDIEDITFTSSTDALSDLLAAYCEEHALPLTDAEELLHEVWAMINEEKDPVLVAQYRDHVNWLLVFINRWNAVQADEDFESAIAARGEKTD
jgi:hypothetical protein